MSKFKIGDKIKVSEYGRGFEQATVLNIYTEKKGKHKGKEMYLLKIMCGIATVPIAAEDNYELDNK